MWNSNWLISNDLLGTRGFLHHQSLRAGVRNLWAEAYSQPGHASGRLARVHAQPHSCKWWVHVPPAPRTNPSPLPPFPPPQAGPPIWKSWERCLRRPTETRKPQIGHSSVFTYGDRIGNKKHDGCYYPWGGERTLAVCRQKVKSQFIKN